MERLQVAVAAAAPLKATMEDFPVQVALPSVPVNCLLPVDATICVPDIPAFPLLPSQPAPTDTEPPSDQLPLTAGEQLPPEPNAATISPNRMSFALVVLIAVLDQGVVLPALNVAEVSIG